MVCEWGSGDFGGKVGRRWFVVVYLGESEVLNENLDLVDFNNF